MPLPFILHPSAFILAILLASNLDRSGLGDDPQRQTRQDILRLRTLSNAKPAAS